MLFDAISRTTLCAIVALAALAGIFYRDLTAHAASDPLDRAIAAQAHRVEIARLRTVTQSTSGLSIAADGDRHAGGSAQGAGDAETLRVEKARLDQLAAMRAAFDDPAVLALRNGL